MYEENLQDTELQCSDCGENFNFSVEEQEFYREKGFSSPKRCQQCRAARRGGGGRRNAGGPRPRFNVVCSECGCETTVPFEPVEGRPVYCSDCYRR